MPKAPITASRPRSPRAGQAPPRQCQIAQSSGATIAKRSASAQSAGHSSATTRAALKAEPQSTT
jgi:hypothetical protein